MTENLHLSVSKTHRDKFSKIVKIKGLSMSEQLRRWIDEEYKPIEQIEHMVKR